MKAIFVLLILLFVCGPGPAADTNRYNVVFIAVDDLRPLLGSYGVEFVQSPHLDRFAEEGLRFNHHFVQVPTCGASRYSLLTGRSPAHTSALRNDAFYQGNTQLAPKMLDGAQTMPEMFRRSGYRTVAIGKISHTADGRVYAYDGSGDGRIEVPHAWDEQPTPYGLWERGWGIFFAYAGGRHREQRNGYMPLMEFKAERDDDLPDGLLAERAVNQLEKLKAEGERFFLGVGFFKPHLPFVATRGDWEALDGVEIPPPAHPQPKDSPYFHKSGEFHQYQLPFPGDTPLSLEDRKTARRAYAAAVRYVDRQIGKVLDAIDELGLRENTVVVVWGDHGWHLGEYALWGKHSPFERALRSALLVRAPGMKRSGQATDALVETLDLYPTLVELCNPSFNRTAHKLDGRSLVPLLNGQADTIRDSAISFWRDTISVRTANHRLIVRNEDGNHTPLELYDMRQGPDPEENFVASQPEIVERLLEMIPNR
jgi:iduronate 2-sulfatase